MPTLVISKNAGLKQVASTAPGEWPRVMIGERIPKGELAIILCEQKTFEAARYITGAKVAVVFDSVRQPKGFFKSLGYPAFTLDAPADGATWLWTPINDAFYDKLEPNDSKTDDVIFIGRTNYRAIGLAELANIGVKVISSWNNNFSYAQYARELKRARAVVNLCADRVTHYPQLKGRVFETLFARTMLLEQNNHLITQKIPRQLYYTWDTLEDLKGVVEEKRSGIHLPAFAGDYVRNHFSADKFWGIVSGHDCLFSQRNETSNRGDGAI